MLPDFDDNGCCSTDGSVKFNQSGYTPSILDEFPENYNVRLFCRPYTNFVNNLFLQIMWNGSVSIPKLNSLSIYFDWINIMDKEFSGSIIHDKPEAGSEGFDCYRRYIACLLDNNGFDDIDNKTITECNWKDIYVVTWNISETQVNNKMWHAWL